MAKRSWYARTSWTADDREDVLARLRSLTGAHEQAACLRKQAGHLVAAAQTLARRGDAGEGAVDQLLAGARELLELFLDWFPDSSERAYVLASLAEVEERAGAIEPALARCREALAAQAGTTRSTNAHLHFGLIALKAGSAGAYDEAWTLLHDFAQPLIYPLDQYHHCAIKAHLLVHRGDPALAALCAKDALAATKHVAVDSETPFHQHLVTLATPRTGTLPAHRPPSPDSEQ